MRAARRTAELLLFPTVALVVALAVVPGRARLALHAWLLVVLGLVLLALVRAVAAAYPRGLSPFVASLRPVREQVERPASLVRLERELTIGCSSAFDVHTRLSPAITELAAALLAASRGIDLVAAPDAARAALGEDVWELVAPGRPEPADRTAPGLDERVVARVVTALEGI